MLDPKRGTVDGGEGRGVPLGGSDERLPTGYREEDDDLPEVDQPRDLDLNWDEDDDAGRRRDPLRRP